MDVYHQSGVCLRNYADSYIDAHAPVLEDGPIPWANGPLYKSGPFAQGVGDSIGMGFGFRGRVCKYI